jgi:hypothetical protein
MRGSMALSRTVAKLVIALAGAALVSCGNTTGGPGGSSTQCSGSSSCGGDLVGSWSVTSVCDVTGVAGVSASCPAAQIDASGVNVSGNLSFKGDMTFASTATLNGTATVSVPGACLMTGGFTLTCDDLSTLLLEIGQGIGGSCTDASSGGCDCTLLLTSLMTTGSGTYSTSGSTLTTLSSDDGGTPSATTASYCVEGSTLTLSSTATSAMSGVTGELAGKISLAKQ